MYDRIIANCPKCAQQIEFQSKYGDCELKTYHISSVPACIAEDIIDESEQCENCGYVVEFVKTPIQRVALQINLENTTYD